MPYKDGEHIGNGCCFCSSIQTVSDASYIGVWVLKLGHKAAKKEKGTDNSERQG